MEEPVNPLLYVLAYGAGFVAQASPTDLAGMAATIEEAIRYPGFAFVNVQSPCVTTARRPSKSRASRPSANPDGYGPQPGGPPRRHGSRPAVREKMHLGVFYRNPEPPPTYGDLVKERQTMLSKDALPKERILDLFIKK